MKKLINKAFKYKFIIKKKQRKGIKCVDYYTTILFQFTF